MKHKIKLAIILGFEFVAITLILVLIFFAGKKSYTVTFDLNGGTLISGELVQSVPQGKNATAPTVAKEGCTLHSWSTSYQRVTRDIVVKAVWEWETKTSIGFDFTDATNSDYCEITGSFQDLVGDVYVSVYFNNKRVLGIQENAFYNRDGITYVHMLDGILSIGNSAFEDCDALVAVELSGTLAKLGNSVFKGCESLSSVILPDTLTVLGTEVFKDCEGLESVVLSKNLTYIPEQAFSGCTSLKEIVIPDGVTVIKANAFEGCTSLTEIVIPASVEAIEEDAFKGCTSLEKITFEVKENTDTEKNENTIAPVSESDLEAVYSGLLSIESGAFANCPALVEVELPITLEYIAPLAFDNENLVIKVSVAEDEAPEGWAENWYGASTVEWEAMITPVVPEEPAPDAEDTKR